MPREIEDYEEVKIFIQDVTEQIQYHPIRTEIKEELLSHIEDRVEEYENNGENRDDAVKNAVIQMGKPVDIGISLNSVRKTKDNWWGIGLGIFAILLAIIGNVREWSDQGFGIHGLFSSFYLPIGIILLLLFYLKGYEILVRKTKVIGYFLCGIISLEVLTLLIRKSTTIYNLDFAVTIWSKLFSSAIIGAMLLIMVPLIVISIYGIRQKGKLAIAMSFAIMLLLLVLSGFQLGFSIVTNELIAIIAFVIILGIMIASNVLNGKKKQLWLWYSIGIVVLFGGYVSVNNKGLSSVSYNLARCFEPESVDHGTLSYAYDSITIRDLLSKAKPFGSVMLTQEEWNVIQAKSDDDDTRNITYDVAKNDNVLNLALPQHYNRNYRIAYWIVKYGWCVGCLLVMVIATLYISLVTMASKIMNQLARMLAITCSISLLLQFIFYLLSNMGYLYGNSVNLPLISDGMCSIVVNMVMFGVILGAYRYDHVWNNWDYKLIYYSVKH
ncbi:permease prefix domain 1-containing protein [Anaerosporobacter sp.]